MGTFSGGGTPTSSNGGFWNGNIPWISSSDLEEDNILKINISRFITQDAIEKSSTKLCKAPSILIVSRVGVGKVALSLNDVCTSQDFTNISELKCDQLYLAFQLSKVMKKAANEVQGTSIKGISSSEIKSKKIFLPPIIEQEKIASFLENIEERIQTQRKIIEKLETLMKVSRANIFSQKFRFKDELGNDFPKWETITLKDIGDIITGKTPSTKDENLWDGEIQFVTPTDINDNKYQYFTERSLKKTDKLNVLPEKSIMFTCIASIGKMSLSFKPCVTNQQINSIIPNSNYDNEFIFYALANISEYIKSTQSSSTMPIINKTEFSKFKIYSPILKEQNKIANFLSSIQEKIETEKQILEKLELQKKFLLGNLFV